MNSADAWHESNADTPNADDLEALLGLSVELVDTMTAAQKEIDMEAAKERHPSSGPTVVVKAITEAPAPTGEKLTAADRCDHCGAGALYRVTKHDVAGRTLAKSLDFCRHAFFKYFPGMCNEANWIVTGSNPSLFAELHGGDQRSKGDDHA